MKINATAFAVALSLSFILGVATNARGADISETTLAAIDINGKRVSTVELVQLSSNGAIGFTRARWQEFGVVLSSDVPGEVVYTRDIGAQVHFNGSTQTYEVSVPAKFLPNQDIGASVGLSTEITKPAMGVMLGYDVAVLQQDSQTFGSLGYDIQSDILGGFLLYTAQFNVAPSSRQHSRALTTWSKDFYQRRLQLQAGDVFATNPYSNLVRTVNLAGLSIGTDRQLSGSPFYPVPVVGGVADTRSTAEIIVNDRSASAELKPGPYQFSNLSYTTGLNDLSLVVRDEFGREARVVRSFYVLPNSLKGGLSEWGAQAGLVREGSLGNAYGAFAASAFYARGLTDRWTVSGGIVRSQGETNIQLGNTWNMGVGGALSLSIAKSGSGSAATLAYERRSRAWSVHASQTRVWGDYWQLSDPRGWSSIPMRTTTLGVGGFVGKVSGDLNYTEILYQEERAAREYFTARLRYRISTSDELSLYARYEPASSTKDVMLSWRHRWGTTTSNVIARAAPDLTINGQLNGRGVVAGVPVTWQASNTDIGAGRTTYASGSAQFKTADVTAGASVGASPMGHARASGAVWIGEGGFVPTRRSYGSWAVVRVPGQSNVSLTAAGQRAITNKNGTAVLSNLVGLHRNTAFLDQRTLPDDVLIESGKVGFTAPRRGGALIDFPTRNNTMRQYQIVRHGAPYAVDKLAYKGSDVRVSEGYFVLDNPEANSVVVAVTPDGSCEAELVVDADLYSISDIECK
ncbi:fimbria/pilus outer membrane usher protein [uncultured Stenotrophomonas sp.]|uniref:fimbria/pilus outer membrane usher protein n=1 Tax=uncultured Stenotrophomonas sp. TaxID=165438 RepID=UPI0028D85DC1|nr:fimbria/pilus outer membrane usher protein [uncultured Stenotrophomonas sp.]